MKRLLRMTTVVACVVVFLSALTITAAEAQKKGNKGPATMALSGCLHKGGEANTFLLTNVSGGGSWGLIGIPAGMNLAPHVGHRINVIGTNIAKPNKAAKIEGKKGAEKKEERGERHLQVQSFKMVSPACP